jgi:hypothetical protein
MAPRLRLQTKREDQIMKLHADMLVAFVLALMPVIASSDDQPLSLKHGMYVRGASCDDAANAEILSWDGVGFSGAHSSQCTSTITRQGGRFRVVTACAALGDGSSNASASAYKDLFSLNRLSSTRFELFRKDQKKATYRWCGVGDSHQ